jgi:hypothetical protein
MRPSPPLRAHDERDAREVDRRRVVLQELRQRPRGQSCRPNGVRVSRRTEGEGDGELVGADRVRRVAVIPAAEVAAQPVVDVLAKLLQSVKHLPGRVAARAAQRDACAVAITRARCDPETQDYIARKKTEGKTQRGAIRCLKRHLARRIWHLLQPPPPTEISLNLLT